MSPKKYDIFISYRRKDSTGKEWGTVIARSILQALESRGYGGRVFLDHEEIGPDYFETKILTAIKQSKVFIFILTKEALLRCNSQEDWVRREIMQAIESNLNFIIINPDNEFQQDFPQDFPVELNIIKKLNHIGVRTGAGFKRDMDHIVSDYIDPIIKRSYKVMSSFLVAIILIVLSASAFFIIGRKMAEDYAVKALEYYEINKTPKAYLDLKDAKKRLERYGFEPGDELLDRIDDKL